MWVKNWGLKCNMGVWGDVVIDRWWYSGGGVLECNWVVGMVGGVV